MECYNSVTSDLLDIKVMVLPNSEQKNISIKIARDNKMKSMKEIILKPKPQKHLFEKLRTGMERRSVYNTKKYSMVLYSKGIMKN